MIFLREVPTGADRRRVAPIVRRWLRSFYERDVDWGPLFRPYEEIFRKTRPVRPVVIYRCPTQEGAPPEDGVYDRWTSWSYDPMINFGRGHCLRNRIKARVHPDDIEVVLPAFGENVYPEGMAEVILRPGRYIVVPAATGMEPDPPLSQANWPQYA